MTYSSRFFLYAPLALFLLLAAGTGAYWWHAASVLSAKLDALNGREAMPGVTVRFASKSVSGFPFNLDVVFADLRVTVKTPHGPSSWRTEKFALHALTYGREQMIFEAAGPQLLTWTDLQGRPHAMPFQTGELHASTIANEHGLARFDLDCIGFGSPALTAGRVQLHARVAPKTAGVELFVTADAVHLSSALTSAFGPDITAVRLNANAVPARIFNGLRVGTADWVGTFEAFRAANGALQVSDLEIDWNKMSAMGKGQLSLDANHAVDGLLDFKIAGMETWLGQHRGLAGGANSGIAAALADRAAKAGRNEAGMLGAVVGFHGGLVSVGDETATTEEPLY
jgi:hypothetical protein